MATGRQPYPAYLSLLEAGELERRAATAVAALASCRVCPRGCEANRLHDERGVCGLGRNARVASSFPHHGEEDCLRGRHGSGTVFFAGCNLECLFCQNWEISQGVNGSVVEPEELAEMMLQLQRWGCHNINLVSPSHVIAPVLAALEIAAHRGLRLPLVYNSGGYDSFEGLTLLDGVVDVYMPDMKYGDSSMGQACSGVPDYREVNQAAVREMHRQVGDLVLDEEGLARKGLLVRHLVLPGQLASRREVLSFLVREISPHTYLNLMDQYRPCYQAAGHPPLDRALRAEEYERALQEALRLGFDRLDGQPLRRLCRGDQRRRL
jgi:putative pyruvate formate lyase activating enzyme